MTRRRVRTVDTAFGLTAFGAAVLAYLFAVALVDQWVVTSGLGFWGRWLFWAVMVTAGGYYLVHSVVPLLVYRISPVFAARAIEQGWPNFKNSLINILFLRREREEFLQDDLSRRVYQGLESQAAAGLRHVSAETAVDRLHLVRASYVLAAVVAICCLYLAISPKSLLASFARVLWPWASIPAPTWVTIDAIEPGSTVAYQGDTIVVSAQVHGLKGSEPVRLVYSSADGRGRAPTEGWSQAVPMAIPPHEHRYQAELPPGDSGLQQDLVYWLSAGDCTTRRFRVEVQTPLAITVERVEYKYPAYTGLPPRTVLREGDLRAVEGTEAEIHANASHPIASAYVELDGESRQSVRMDYSGNAAAGRVTLKLKPEDPKQPDASRRPEFTSYQLRFTDAKQRENRRPVRYQIEVDQDQKPKVRFVAPTENEVSLLANDSLELKVAAEDDFGLRRVAIVAEVAGKPLPLPALLEVAAPQKATGRSVEKGYPLKPSDWKLKGGERVTYWAEALDNKEDGGRPAYQKADTEKRVIVIVAPEPQQPPREGGQGGDNRQNPAPKPGASTDQGPQPAEPNSQPPVGPNEAPKQPESGKTDASPPSAAEKPKPPGQESGPSQANQKEQPGGAGSDKGELSAPGEAPQPAPKPGSQADKPEEAIRGETNPADAMDEILQYRDQQEKQEQAKQQPGQENPKPGEKQPSGPGASGAAGKQPSAGQQQPGAKQPDATQGQDAGQQPDNAAGQPQPGTKEKPSAEKKPGTGGQPGASPEGPNTPGQSTNPPAGSKEPAGKKAPTENRPDSAGAKPAPGEPGQSPGPEKQPTSEGAGEPKPKTGPGAGQEGPESKGSAPTAGQEDRQPGAKPSGSGDARPGAKEKPVGPAQETPPAKGAIPKPESEPGSSGTSADRAQPKPTPRGEGDPRKKEPRDLNSLPAEKQKPDRDQTPAERGMGPGAPKSEKEPPSERSPAGGAGERPKADRPGTGKPGEKTSSDQGAASQEKQGAGGVGEQPGPQAKPDQPAGKSGPKGEGQGPGDQKEPSGPKPPNAAQKPAEPPDSRGGQPDAQQGAGRATEKGSQQTSPTPGGTAGHGGMPGDRQGSPPPVSESPPSPPDAANLEYARQRTNLALRTLQEELAKEKSPLLDRLGWTPADAAKFLREWETMMKAAQEQGPRGKDAKRELDKALQSLGLRPGSTQSPASRGSKDQVQSRDPGRFDPPPEWADFFEAYNKSAGSAKP